MVGRMHFEACECAGTRWGRGISEVKVVDSVTTYRDSFDTLVFTRKAHVLCVDRSKHVASSNKLCGTATIRFVYFASAAHLRITLFFLGSNSLAITAPDLASFLKRGSDSVNARSRSRSRPALVKLLEHRLEPGEPVATRLCHSAMISIQLVLDGHWRRALFKRRRICPYLDAGGHIWNLFVYVACLIIKRMFKAFSERRRKFSVGVQIVNKRGDEPVLDQSLV